MALVPNTWTKSTFDPGPDQVDWTEGLGPVSVEIGFYKNPTRPKEEIMIERTKVVTNQMGTEIRRDEERWQYDVPGAPPLRYEHRIYARTYLPGMGRALRLVQDETHYFWAFSPLTDGANLGRTRVVSGYVVYDLPEDPLKGLSGEAAQKALDKGYQAGTLQDRLVSSGKRWDQANEQSAVVEEASAAQATKWIDGMIVEHDEVEEEFDKWTIWTTEKDALRSGGVKVAGPRYIRKESYTYKLPVPLMPPEISASPGEEGITVDIEGGGATITNSYFGPSGTFEIRPESYNVYRKIITEPDRTPDPNEPPWWETPPAAGGARMILTDTDVTEFDGGDADSLPAQSSYTEPHDPEPEDLPRDTEFRRIGEVENSQGKEDVGAASFLDTDCEDTAEYEYYATAVYGSQESSDSNHETVTFSGTGTRSYRMVITDAAVDVIAPNDPAYPEQDFGEVVEFDLPADDPEPVAEEVAERQFAMNRAADFNIRLTILHPLIGLEWGQKVSIPNIEWNTFANALHLTTETDNDVWMLTGFKRVIKRSKDGSWQTPDTVLTLQERPRPQ